MVVGNETHEPVSDDSVADFQTHKKNKRKEREKRRSGTKVLLVRRNQMWEAVSQDSDSELTHKGRDKQPDNLHNQEAVKTVASLTSTVVATSESEASDVLEPRKRFQKHDYGQKTRAGAVKATNIVVISSDSDFMAPKRRDQSRKRNQKRNKSRNPPRYRKQQVRIPTKDFE